MIAALILAAAAVPACTPGQLQLTTGGPAGDISGMSHAGTYLMVRNNGRARCRVDPLPAVVFLDRHGRRLFTECRTPVGLHPGPVLRPVAIPPGGSIRTALRWVSGEVFDRSRCIDAAAVTIAVQGRTFRVPLRARLCGEQGRAIAFEQGALEPAAR